ncbi:hypothetical protein EB796_022053 [Bugula neritina]|uniref:Uncharacterized protein n=1 Tax=Bugula neritina TaxID=10212 RepID=A0A7J7J1S9_BUGNE|nr:hypothetical protein EB796_022053 [Bugula neritina]
MMSISQNPDENNLCVTILGLNSQLLMGLCHLAAARRTLKAETIFAEQLSTKQKLFNLLIEFAFTILAKAICLLTLLALIWSY